MALAKGDLGMCFEGLYHLSTTHLSDYCFCHFVSQIIIPDPQIIPHPILCFCFWPYPAMLFFFSFNVGILDLPEFSVLTLDDKSR